MPRAKLVYRPEEFPGPVGNDKREQIDALFEHMKGFAGKPEIPGTAGAFAIVARDPKLALLLLQVSDYMTRECPWTTDRKDLRQLLIQTLNWHFKCDFNFQSHLSSAERDGISAELQAAIPYWEVTTIFNEEQLLVIEYTLAACKGEVTDDMFARVSKQFGEGSALEITNAVAWWAFWAIVAGAVRPAHDFGYSTPSKSAA